MIVMAVVIVMTLVAVLIIDNDGCNNFNDDNLFFNKTFIIALMP